MVDRHTFGPFAEHYSAARPWGLAWADRVGGGEAKSLRDSGYGAGHWAGVLSIVLQIQNDLVANLDFPGAGNTIAN